MVCEYCCIVTKEDLRGSDGVIYDINKRKYILYAEHFRNERVYIEIDYCPKCGRKLS